MRVVEKIHPSSIKNWDKVEEYRLKSGKLPCENKHTFHDDMELEMMLSVRYGGAVLDYMSEEKRHKSQKERQNRRKR